jgi:hypothetical protein
VSGTPAVGNRFLPHGLVIPAPGSSVKFFLVGGPGRPPEPCLQRVSAEGLSVCICVHLRFHPEPCLQRVSAEGMPALTLPVGR